MAAILADNIIVCPNCDNVGEILCSACNQPHVWKKI